MDKRPKWRRLFPNWRYWVSPSALVGILSGVYWVIIGVTGVASTKPDAGFAWQFLVIGVLFSVLSWWALAHSNSEADRRSDEMPGKTAALVIEALGLKPRLDEAMQDLLEARGDAAAERRAREHITKLFNDVIDSLDRTVRNDVAGIEAIVGIKETLLNDALPPEQRIAEASKQATAYYGKRASGRIVFVGDADLLRKQLEQSSGAPSPKESR